MVPPFVVSDRGDVYVVNDLQAMYAQVEAIDASTMEFFDAAGRPIRVIVEGYKWHVDQHGADVPAPDRLVGILRDYFARLPAALTGFSARAAAATSLDELVQLRLELAAAPDPGRWSRLFKRSWG